MTTRHSHERKIAKHSDLILKVEKILRNEAVHEKLSGALTVDSRKFFVSLDDNVRALQQLQTVIQRKHNKLSKAKTSERSPA